MHGDVMVIGVVWGLEWTLSEIESIGAMQYCIIKMMLGFALISDLGCR